MNGAGELEPTAESEEMRFGFGKNWEAYVDSSFSEERAEIARRHLLAFLKLDNLEGKSFLDIGCGSGLHSLAAWRSGAASVTSFDYDISSVTTSQKLHRMVGGPSNWTIVQGSVLDRPFMDGLSQVDIVYSWGVLHHTGELWNAIENAARRVNSNGVFYIALYSKEVYVNPSAEYWLGVKRAYNQASAIRKRGMEWRYAFIHLLSQAMKGRNPLRYMREYKQSRGMSYWHDLRDWLGGWPMEFAGNKETEQFMKRTLDFDLLHLRAGEGNTEFLFRPSTATNYWDAMVAANPKAPLKGPFRHERGHAWVAELGDEVVAKVGDPRRLMVYENGSPLGWPDARASAIAKYGNGRYRVDGKRLLFSSSNRSNPNQEGRLYELRTDFL